MAQPYPNGPCPADIWSRYVGETIGKHAILIATVMRLMVMALLILRDDTARTYMDQALTPVGSDGDEALDLFTKTTGGGAHVAHVKRVAAAIERGRQAA